MLKNLRNFMQNEGISLFIVNSTDEYLSEYVALQKNSRYLITGFSGSTGNAIVTADKVFLFVDGRYHLQAEQETDPDIITVEKVGLDISPTKALCEKLSGMAAPDAKIGIVSTKTSCTAFKELQKIREAKESITIAEYEFDPVQCHPELDSGSHKLHFFDNLSKKTESLGQARNDRCDLKQVPTEIAGLTQDQKLELILKYKQENDIELLLITSLDEIAYLTNLRGDEIPYSSCFKAKALVYKNELHVFRKENEFEEFLACINPKNAYYCPASATLSAYRKIEKITDKIIEIKDSHISKMKSVKNTSELAYIKECYRKTDIVVNRTYCWLDQNIEKGVKITEKDLSEKVKALFKEEGATCLSFEPITASAENTAIIHYTHPNPDKVINKNDLVLIDCGGYFEFGYATDQTRVFLAGGSRATADDQQKRLYTVVLKGLLAGLNIDLKEASTGYDLDKTVRDVIDSNRPEGFSFGHATGHGVGIAVHESPPRIGPTDASKSILREGMVFTIEPGLYCDGVGGVRLENTVTIENGKIKTLTRAGFDSSLIDYDMLSDQEKSWLEDYNRQKIG